MSYFRRNVYVPHLSETNSPPKEDHQPKNCCHVSKTESLDTGLTYSLVEVFTFTLHTTPSSPGNISTTSSKGL